MWLIPASRAALPASSACFLALPVPLPLVEEAEEARSGVEKGTGEATTTRERAR